MVEHVAGRDAEVVAVLRRQVLKVATDLVHKLKAELCARAVCGVGLSVSEKSENIEATISCKECSGLCPTGGTSDIPHDPLARAPPPALASCPPRPCTPPKCRSYLGVGGTSTHGELVAPVNEAEPMCILEALAKRTTRDDNAPRFAEVSEHRGVAHSVRRALPAVAACVVKPQPIYERAHSAVE